MNTKHLREIERNLRYDICIQIYREFDFGTVTLDYNHDKLVFKINLNVNRVGGVVVDKIVDKNNIMELLIGTKSRKEVLHQIAPQK